jgi:hypothetical protein
MITSTETAREYRGKRYLVFKDEESGAWRWAVTLDDLTTKTGEARTLQTALAKVVMTVDQSLAVSAGPAP